jgi:hypothetical protein
MHAIKYLVTKIIYILNEKQICMQFNISVKMLFTSWLKSEYIGNSVNQQKVVYIVVEEVIERNSIYRSKCCLHRDWRGIRDEIQYINQKVVYIVIEERIYMKFNASIKMLFTSWLKSEYIRNSINQQNVVYIVVEEVIERNSIYQLKCCLRRG